MMIVASCLMMMHSKTQKPQQALPKSKEVAE